MAANLLDRLRQYSESDAYPLHMPGHKRRIRHFDDPFAIDITEIDGFDNLHHAEGILLEAQMRASALYGAEETYYLVNGSTCGILAAVSAAVPQGGRLLMARNCHKSCYHASFLNNLRVTYLYPPSDCARGICGSISPDAVRRALENCPEIRAVLITSPTYDGVVSDVRAIADEAHRAGALLIVDEAHGAHFGMHPCLPRPALACGADIVIHSLHKTLPSLTQTALLHVQGALADREKIRKYLGIYQSSSPSYVLMAGMDACVSLLEERGGELFAEFAQRLLRMRGELRRMQVLHLVDGREPEISAYDYDCSKIVVSVEDSGLTGPQLAGLLREKYHLEPEMQSARCVTAIMTVADTQEGFDRLAGALLAIDEELWTKNCGRAGAGTVRNTGEAYPENEKAPGIRDEGETYPENEKAPGIRDEGETYSENEKAPGIRDEGETYPENEKAPGIRNMEEAYPENEEVLSIRDAEEAPAEAVPLWDSAGRVSAEYVYLYPPGIPLLVPGERISDRLLRRLHSSCAAGLELQGPADATGSSIRVVQSREPG